ncbi:MAG TPA: ABC transporter permease [Candidatus Eisenbergiella merdavium]|uniref:ABC transporter permease n=1 Tax=Candidatus Eisenbergiella merdavium TaxID=2838551 RepID=A0A9D2NB10_9FIRM|nr:ABC transporter permease [Candidatus Eisenbergiella merdavium]
MKGLKYQLKSILRDKMCLLTFLLPAIVGIAINLLSGVSFQSIGETTFGVVENRISDASVGWLQNNGTVVIYETFNELEAAVIDPSTQMIGVLQVGDTIQTIIAGDELEVNKVIATTLPQIYENRTTQLSIVRSIIPVQSDNEGIKSLLIVITLVTAMFMGCTFNAMNIINEKEDGIEFINQVLPMSMKSYMIQKTLVGFAGGTVSTIITALICMQIQVEEILPFLLIVFLSAYIAALTGLFIGYFANSLMVGIVYIKIVMILFLAPPIFFYLIVPNNSIAFRFSYLIPSSATFYGIMDLISGRTKEISPVLLALCIHAVFWSIVYKLMRKLNKIST